MPEFRKDIQALRGISLLLVYLYHYNKKLLPAGFIGVDIFFFISGYVNVLSYISKINLGSILFIFNRVKRLFSVSHLIIYFSIFNVTKLNVLYQNSQYIDIIYAALSVSNFRFIYSSIDYLSQSESPSIVLHYWSLAIEDQFYILFPFFITYIYKSLDRIIIIMIISFSYSWFLNANHHFVSYFSLLSRSWQFIFGILLARKECNIL